MVVALQFCSCEKFLEERPKSSLAKLSTVQDYQSIMANETQFNGVFPFAGDFSSDYYYLDDAAFLSLVEETRHNYLWEAEPPNVNNWNQTYSAKVYPANVTIEGIDHSVLGNFTEFNRQQVKGEAFFSRGFAFYHLAQIFAPSYQKDKAKELLGIPIRLTSDINVATTRTNLEETYSQILSDLHASAFLLPSIPRSKVRPGKSAAYAALSRAYLIMQDFKKAELYADSCLSIYNTLIDYNDLNLNSTQSQFPILNNEVIFHAIRTNSFSPLGASRANVDTLLYNKYELNDLRRNLFYRTNAAGIRSFYADYGGNLTSTTFCGIATDEVYLTSAECKIRNGDIVGGLKRLNDLLRKRYVTNQYVDFITNDQKVALRKVLEEREKELAFRSGIRWSDLRRLNLEPEFAKTIYRKINGQVYKLEPNDKRYTFKIPYDVIRLSGIQQND